MQMPLTAANVCGRRCTAKLPEEPAMTPFAFHRPASVASAVQLRSTQADASYLAGGQSLLPAMKLGLAAPSDLVDLSLLPGMQGIALDGGSAAHRRDDPHAVGGGLDRGAEAHPGAGLPGFGHRRPGRAHARHARRQPGATTTPPPVTRLPCWAWAPPCTPTDARSPPTTSSRACTRRRCEPGELITAVSFPIPQRAAYVKFKQPASRFALVGVFVSEGPQGVRVAVTGAAVCVFRAPLSKRRWAGLPGRCPG